MNLYLTDRKGLLFWIVRSVYLALQTDLETYSALLSVFIEVFVFLNFQLYRCFDLYR